MTSAALGEDAVKGRHVVKIIPKELDGKSKPEVALGTLELGRTGGFGQHITEDCSRNVTQDPPPHTHITTTPTHNRALGTPEMGRTGGLVCMLEMKGDSAHSIPVRM